jgi:hypothetical protein
MALPVVRDRAICVQPSPGFIPLMGAFGVTITSRGASGGFGYTVETKGTNRRPTRYEWNQIVRQADNIVLALEGHAFPAAPAFP